MPKEPFTFTCPICHETKTKMLWPSMHHPTYCGIQCRNVGNGRKTLNRVTKTCLVCGTVFEVKASHAHQKCCSTKCGHIARVQSGHASHNRVYTPEDEDFLREYYPKKGGPWCAEQLGKTKSSVRNKIHRLGLRNYHLPELLNHTSGTEQALLEALQKRNIEFVHSFVIKPNFVVDFFIPPCLIIQVDGDYWHGNPVRFPKLSKRQLKQQRRDRSQEKYMLARDFKILRIWEWDIVHHLETCMDTIAWHVNFQEALPSLTRMAIDSPQDQN